MAASVYDRDWSAKSGAEQFAAFCALLAISTFSLMWYAFAMVKLWGWFVVPAFHVSALTIPVAIGLDLLWAALRGPDEAALAMFEARTVGGAHWHFFRRSLSQPMALLTIGWIASRFM